jgi:enediyne polyketide synthase
MKLESSEATRHRIAEPIAVVGMDCYYPGANRLIHLWENILSKRCQFRQLPNQRLPIADYYDPDVSTPDKTYGKRAAVLDGFEFDWVQRRVPKTAVDSTDIVHWLALEVAIKALEDAGYNRETVPTEQAGVILGNTLTGEHTRSNVMRLRWPYVRRALQASAQVRGLSETTTDALMETMEQFYKSVFAPITEDSLAGGLSNTIAGRICSFFNFDGGGYTVDGACSSSLIAVVTAANALSNGDLDLALAGGVDISLDTFELIGFAKTGALTKSEMRVYDHRASGFIPGEGCGFAVLKRLADARRDNNYVYAVLNGWGISSDGKGSITAPSKVGQSKALQRAYAKAGYSPHTLHFIEGHGTGTPVGDRTEIEGIALAMSAYGETKPRSCGITSFKSLVGHTKAAAGIGGLIKAVMAVNQRIVPPTVSCQDPNPVFEQTAQCLYPVLQGKIYPSTATLRAGVSAMGFGGINSHITLSSGDVPAPHLKPFLDERALLVSHQDSELFILDAQSLAALLEKTQKVVEQAKGMSSAELVDLAAYLTKSIDKNHVVRAAIIIDTPDELINQLQQLEQILKDSPPNPGEVKISLQKDLWVSNQVKKTRIAFLFPGQGSQRLNMARTLIERYEWARQFLQQADNWLIDAGFEAISSIIYRPLEQAINQQQTDEWFQVLTAIAPQAICFISLLWQRYLKRLEIKPIAVGGHSLGELTAFAAAGAYDEKTLLCFAAFRSRAMTHSTAQKGIMASLACSQEKAQELLKEVLGYVVIANLNSPKQMVISGDIASVQAVIEKATIQGIQTRQLAVANAFHSQMMESAAIHILKNAPIPSKLDKTDLLLLSSINGQFVQKGLPLKEHFAQQTIAQVNFIALGQNLAKECDLMLEVGPGKVLSGLMSEVADSPLCLPLESKPGSNRDLNTALACYFVYGGEINWKVFYEKRLTRTFVEANQRLFIDNPCERPLLVDSNILAQMTPLSIEHEGLSDDEIFQIINHYLTQRGSFIAELISADLTSSLI